MAYPTSREENLAEIERAAGERLKAQREADEARRAEVEEHNRNWRARRDAQLKAERERRESAEARQLEDALWQRYADAGGSRDDFNSEFDELVRQHRRDVALGKTEPIASKGYSDPKRWGLT